MCFLFFLQEQNGGGGGEGAPGILCRQGLQVWRRVVPRLGSPSCSLGKRDAVPSFHDRWRENESPGNATGKRPGSAWNRRTARQQPPLPPAVTAGPDLSLLSFRPRATPMPPQQGTPASSSRRLSCLLPSPLPFLLPLNLWELPRKSAPPQRGYALCPGFDLIPSWHPQAPALLMIHSLALGLCPLALFLPPLIGKATNI